MLKNIKDRYDIDYKTLWVCSIDRFNTNEQTKYLS